MGGRAAMVRRDIRIPRFRSEIMADHIVPHFHNDPGVAVIEIGAREFMCVGARPPLDHPHVFLDMGDDKEIICPYCSTLYRHDPALDPACGAARGLRPDRSGLTARAPGRGVFAQHHHRRRRYRRT